ncbi:glycosyltransferase family 8 protein [Paracoccus homiensis]|uniref:Lipopolysaccharide biosynthesis protein, LPS:glycosyltransferase n=1 Tax=Paracoccus homiensis TaxID=364199 RepID=A0A1I0J3T9_9RHOB|nr:glycosyltransferase [Paracoccus homiensis]SEU04406.1 Lipopolysaccharide biosynthesis protein, LPS:glycosyltransferase [Paracoccus homiensis]
MLQLAFITDKNALDPTLLAMWSAIRHAKAPLRVAFLGIGFAAADWARVKAVAALSDNCTLASIDFDPTLLKGVASPSGYISSATFARLYLHRLLSGRVLYLDGDILVTGDLSPLAYIDLQGAAIAAVPDYMSQKWISAARQGGQRRKRKAQAKLARLREITAPEDYVNAGVVLMDLDAITADPVLAAAMENVEAAAAMPLADQDHLNRVFAGRILHLQPQWNCSWRRLAQQQANLAASGITTDPTGADRDAVVIHYHGRHKPWQKMPLKYVLRFWPLFREYRRERARMQADLDARP